MNKRMIDVQGHRGCRGLQPENTIPAFEKALKLGVSTLELDVVITADGAVVVSHEPFLSHEICSDTNGERISEDAERTFNIYQMTFTELQQYDCGLQDHPRFPDQEKTPVTKPKLEDVIRHSDSLAIALNRPLAFYNIETKSTPKGDSIYHPLPAEFTNKLVEVIKRTNSTDRVTIQSFDVRTLQHAHINYPNIRLVLLVENNESIDVNLEKLGFTPDIYSCDYTLLNQEGIQSLQEKNIQVVPWTVNEVEDMKSLLNLGVDGIITDYPNRLMTLLKEDEVLYWHK
jgi:glycerophosphoryl diester phosphodiesterase